MRNRVLGLVYVNAYGILTETTGAYRDFYHAQGFHAEVIDLAQPDGGRILAEHLDSGEVAFCYGLQGVGSQLERGGVNLWTAMRTPFMGLHYDNPCYHPFNHGNASPYIANLYHFESFLDIQRRYIGGNQISELLPFDILVIPPEPKLAFRDRPIKLLFMKAGGAVDEFTDYFNALPRQLRDAVWDRLKLAERDPNLQICDLADRAMIENGFDRRQHEKDFWGLVQAMDFYLRRKRAIDFVEWLKFQDGAVIIGDGWDIIDRAGARAEFRAPIPWPQAYALYEQAQFVCNANPYGRDLIHERVVLGLLKGCCVLSDANQWWDQNFAEVPALTRFRWDRPLEDQLRPALEDMTQAETRAATGRDPALRHFANTKNMERVALIASQVRNLAASAA
jgi:hypothetical protein